ncbi:MAG: DNA/RNA non-specific endonuclease, partial [Planctomycetota bacterium]
KVKIIRTGLAMTCVLILASCLLMPPSVAQPSGNNLSDEQKALIEEHVYGGLPSEEHIYVRNAYVLCYNPETRTPNWVAYHVTADYRNTPKRKGKFSSFRVDPEITGEAKNSDYNGLLSSRGYARGHLAPYGIMGGNRYKDDGKYAEYHPDDSSNVGDEKDAQTVYQGNYMSNIAPQHHTGFNGSGGLWFELERWIQDDMVRDQEEEVWVFAGCIFGKGTPEKVGKEDPKDIWVPPMFYKIVIMEDEEADLPIVLAYLLPHQRVRHGDIDSFLVSVDVIEALTGVDFFKDLDDRENIDEEDVEWLEDVDTWNFAKEYFTTD